jgi:sucrose phosphorylase
LTLPVLTSQGSQDVWCTFSHDQVDFDFSNPEVLLEFVKIIRLYLDRGIRIFRLDAVAFTWKRSGTTCINLPEAHDLVRLLRALLEYEQPDAVVITETNVPNIENLAYFGQRDEAHCIYNFALPPLLIHTLIEADCSRLTRWLMSMPPAVLGTTYFNFLASHDGVGLRPVEGLLSSGELDSMVDCLQSNGALLSWRETAEGDRSIYEVNVSLYDAFKFQNADVETTLARMILAHAIVLGLEGIPALYIHSFLGTQNDVERVENTGHNRAINRHQWDKDELTQRLIDPESHHALCLSGLKALIQIRQRQPAFHPNATQYTLNCGQSIFGFWRQSHDRVQSIFCLYNVTGEATSISLASLNLVGNDSWEDLISGLALESAVDGEIAIMPYQAIWLTNRPA